jgi:hypothetical protein
MDVVAMITALSDAVSAVSKEITERSELNNQPKMQQALVIQRVQAALDVQRQEVQDEDITKLRALLAAPAITS